MRLQRSLLFMAIACSTACAAAGEGTTPDAAVAQAPRSRPAREIVAGAARLRGAGVRMDVEIGHAMAQRPVSGNLAGGKATVSGNAAVLP